MAHKFLFGLSLEEMNRRCMSNDIPCDKNSPINTNEYLEPCIRGAEKILQDEETKNLIKRFLRGRQNGIQESLD